MNHLIKEIQEMGVRSGLIKPQSSGHARMTIVASIGAASVAAKAGDEAGEGLNLVEAVIQTLGYFGSRGWLIESHLSDHVTLVESDDPLEAHMQFVDCVSSARAQDEEKNLGRMVGLIQDYSAKRGWDFGTILPARVNGSLAKSLLGS